MPYIALSQFWHSLHQNTLKVSHGFLKWVMATTWKCSWDYLEYVKVHKNKMLGKENNEEHFISLEYKRNNMRKAMVAEAQKVLVQKNKKNQKDDLLDDPSVEDNAIGSLFA